MHKLPSLWQPASSTVIRRLDARQRVVMLSVSAIVDIALRLLNVDAQKLIANPRLILGQLRVRAHAGHQQLLRFLDAAAIIDRPARDQLLADDRLLDRLGRMWAVRILAVELIEVEVGFL